MPHESAPQELGDVALGNEGEELIENQGKARAAAEAEDALQTSAVELDRDAMTARLEATNKSDEWSHQLAESEEADALEEQAAEHRRMASEMGDRAAEEYEFSHPESISEKQRAELAEQAAADWKKEQQEIYTTAVRKAVGTIEAIKRGLIHPMGIPIGTMKSPERSRRELDKDLLEELRKAIYKEAGAAIPSDDEFAPYGTTSKENSIDPGSELTMERVEKRGSNGVTIVQDRFYKRRLGIRTRVADEIYAASTDFKDKMRNPKPDGSDPHDY